MVKLIEAPALMQEFNLYGVRSEKHPELEIELNTDARMMLLYDEYLENIKEWARCHYPSVDPVRHCSFAVLVMYFATERDGEYGTELDQLERTVENLTRKFYKDLMEDVTDKIDPIQMSVILISFLKSHLLDRR